MIKEHAKTVKELITLEDLDYMVKKANLLGLKNRQLFRVFSEEDAEGKHIYFEVENLKPKETTWQNKDTIQNSMNHLE